MTQPSKILSSFVILVESYVHYLLVQEALLKAELRNMERMQKREGVDMTYLKNVVLKLLETGT